MEPLKFVVSLKCLLRILYSTNCADYIKKAALGSDDNETLGGDTGYGTIKQARVAQAW